MVTLLECFRMSVCVYIQVTEAARVTQYREMVGVETQTGS